jgi:hypothetical protein
MIVGIDTEFFDSQEARMKVVAAVLSFPTETKRYNLLNLEEQYSFQLEMDKIKERKDILIAHATAAEARSLMALGLEPFDYQWIDTYIEFTMLCNSNDKYRYGDYLGDTGDIRTSFKPDPSSDEESILDHTETPKSLVNTIYKMLGIKLDQEQKEAMRTLILSKNLIEINERINEILDYCESDTIHLINLDAALTKAFESEGLFDFREDQLARGRYAVATAKSENLGIPINLEFLNKIINKTPEILDMHKETVNGYFRYFLPETQRPPKQYKNGRIFHYKPTPAKKSDAAYQEYVGTLGIRDFPRTKSGKFKSDKETLEAWGYWKGLEALWKYNKTEASLKWFNKDNKNGFFDRFSYVDESVRPYFGIFGTQTGRNAAKAKTFPLAMSSWLRSIVRPRAGHFIIGSDFSQQEVYVAAILSKDNNLLEAYNSGDVYLAFAKQAGLVPPEATKSTHKLERMLCKSTVLGLQFGMGHEKLKIKLKLDSGQEITDEKTAELINAHKSTYQDYWAWVKQLSSDYKAGTPLVTNDGWVLWCDNPVMTSVRNFPVQANAAAITRLAIVRCWEMGLQVMCGLHDAIYVISKNPDIDEGVLNEIMLWATEQILREDKTTMRIDSKVIGSDEIWIEEKGQNDWEKLKEFLT